MISDIKRWYYAPLSLTSHIKRKYTLKQWSDSRFRTYDKCVNMNKKNKKIYKTIAWFLLCACSSDKAKCFEVSKKLVEVYQSEKNYLQVWSLNMRRKDLMLQLDLRFKCYPHKIIYTSFLKSPPGFISAYVWNVCCSTHRWPECGGG